MWFLVIGAKSCARSPGLTPCQRRWGYTLRHRPALRLQRCKVYRPRKEQREWGDVTLDDIVRETGGGHPRTNYHRLIARAVKGLDSSAEARQLIYERARKALIAHLRFNQPGLSKAVIVKERLALDEAIRNIEAEAVRKSRPEIPTQPTTAIRSLRAPDGGTASEPPDWPAVRPDPREQLWSGWSAMEEEAVSGFREEVREVHDFGAVTPTAMQTAPQTGEPYEEEEIEPIVDPHDLYWFKLDTPQERDREDADGSEDQRLTRLPQVRATRGMAPEAERTGHSISYGALATLLVALIMVVGSAAAVFWEWPAILEFYIFLGHSGAKPKVRPATKRLQHNPNWLDGFRSSSRVAKRSHGRGCLPARP